MSRIAFILAVTLWLASCSTSTVESSENSRQLQAIAYYDDLLYDVEPTTKQNIVEQLDQISNLDDISEIDSRLLAAKEFDDFVKSKFDDDSPVRLLSCLELGRANILAFEYDEAARTLESGKDDFDRALDRDHPVKAQILSELGNAYESLGDWPNAISNTTLAANQIRSLTHDKHPRLAVQLLRLGDRLVSAGKAETAAPYLREALEIHREAPPMVLANTLRKVARGESARGMEISAKLLLQEAVELIQQAPNSNRREFLETELLLDLASYQRPESAIASYKRVISLRQRQPLDRPNPMLAQPHLGLGQIHMSRLDFAQARSSLLEAIRHAGPEDGRPSILLSRAYLGLGNIDGAKGDLKGGEEWLTKAVRVVELDPKLGLDNLYAASILEALAATKNALGKKDEAEDILRRVISIADTEKIEREGDLVVRLAVSARSSLADVLSTSGRETSALELLEETIALTSLADGNFSQDIVDLRLKQADILFYIGDRSRAAELYADNLNISSLEKITPDQIRMLSVINAAELMAAKGDFPEAIDLLTFFSTDNRWADFAIIRILADFTISRLYLAANDPESALRSSARASAIANDRFVIGASPDARTGVSGGLPSGPAVLAITATISARARLLLKDRDQSATGAALIDLQLLALNTASAALQTRLADRFASSPEAASLALKWRNLSDQARALDQEIASAAISIPNRTDHREALLRQRFKVARDRDSTEMEIRAAFPDFFELIRGEPVSLSELQSGLLRSDEALVLLTPGNLALPTGHRRGLVFVVTAEGSAWGELGQEPDALSASIAALHEQLQYGGETRAPGQPDLEVMSFDREAAHDLYNALFGSEEIAALLANKERWVLAPQGELMSLPFAALVTEPPAGSDLDPNALRTTSWLGIDKTLAIVPSVSSLRVQRLYPAERVLDAERIPFLGIGDPAFSGEADGEGVCRTGETSGRAPGAARNYFSDETSNLGALAGLSRLPCTAQEVRALASAFGDGSRILLQLDATEGALRAANEAGPLAQTDVIAFATHGLIAGDLAGSLAEPALALTPVKTEGEINREDDGLLTASEVAGLTLSADWVILSACNTAAAGAPDAESLSGLARAFFYAGAESLLVSHFPVYDDAAERLTSRAVALNAGTSEAQSHSACSHIAPKDRAAAMRRSMCELIHDTSNDNIKRSFAHPKAWAPFVLIDAQ